MLDLSNFDLSSIPVKDSMIDAEIVAHVQLQNPLEHALLVLTKTGYNAVPVLDLESKFCGIISKSNIVEEMFGIEQIEVSRLHEKKVEDVMESDVPTITEQDSLEKALHILINYSFVCVVDEEEKMQGIYTRREILKQIRNEFYRQQSK
ncbi:cyclic-di-AMP-binding protein CbpB [Tenuibacillus multivorans]|uniref:CBS domain-containing protein n=1 Tax=Tenuibacillus multivorans TaxID=237069 RepID=A0A1G9YCL8_9BACI|nr:cyclic-di-AMP-binding protein CbpB [Tenuibacillus multivorans]GEL76046.1 CBS domain-containing protein [Tenuibacillus multivorans]SDN06859.1 CBS domain-containing protein [Tenuibacillus multivorans]